MLQGFAPASAYKATHCASSDCTRRSRRAARRSGRSSIPSQKHRVARPIRLRLAIEPLSLRRSAIIGSAAMAPAYALLSYKQRGPGYKRGTACLITGWFYRAAEKRPPSSAPSSLCDCAVKANDEAYGIPVVEASPAN
jgi:hypothetical protein